MGHAGVNEVQFTFFLFFLGGGGGLVQEWKLMVIM